MSTWRDDLDAVVGPVDYEKAALSIWCGVMVHVQGATFQSPLAQEMIDRLVEAGLFIRIGACGQHGVALTAAGWELAKTEKPWIRDIPECPYRWTQPVPALPGPVLFRVAPVVFDFSGFVYDHGVP